MPRNLTDGKFYIVSVGANERRLGVSPTRPAFQPIVVDGIVNDFVFKSVTSTDPGKTYEIGIGNYPSTGVVEDVVNATVHEDQKKVWTVEYRELQDAYTIVLKDDYKGWSLAPGSEIAQGTPVGLGPIISTKSIPPQFLPFQLFKLIPVSESEY